MKIKLTEQQLTDLTQKIIDNMPDNMGDVDLEKDAPNLSKLIKTIAANRNANPLSPTNVATSKVKKSLFGRNKNVKPEVKFADEIPIGDQMMHPLGHKEQITSMFGQRNTGIPGATKNHKGIDISTRSGSPIYAPLDGVVMDARDTSPNACGGLVRLEHINMETKFCHLSRFNVRIGDKVKKGQIIAYSGGGRNDPMRGISTGPHLHYEILNKSGVAMNPTSVEHNLV